MLGGIHQNPYINLVIRNMGRNDRYSAEYREGWGGTDVGKVRHRERKLGTEEKGEYNNNL